MSAFYVAKYEDRIEILTDGAVYSDDGTIVSIERKIWISDHLPLTFVGRGSHPSVNLISTAMGLLSFNKTVDETLVLFMEKIEAMAEKPGEKVQLDGLVCGISETLGPIVYYFCTSKQVCEERGLEPFKIYEVPDEMCAATNPTPRAIRNSGLPMFWAIDGLAEYGGVFFDTMRQFTMKHVALPDQPDMYAIGGHVDHTVIRADGIVSERILEWPDKIGEKIDPARLAA
ncbi:hypothetical protein [Brucella sp. BO2]|uniref:hypothetical protein n=1 Tax=Brucella sp. BO2 TaxID=693750 RepID=UPI0002F00779|nr:hypothetical protein [Brucella sp. BO2]